MTFIRMTFIVLRTIENITDKGAGTFAITLAAIDAKRDDRKAYSIAYVEA